MLQSQHLTPPAVPSTQLHSPGLKYIRPSHTLAYFRVEASREHTSSVHRMALHALFQVQTVGPLLGYSWEVNITLEIKGDWLDSNHSQEKHLYWGLEGQCHTDRQDCAETWPQTRQLGTSPRAPHPPLERKGPVGRSWVDHTQGLRAVH